MILWTGDVSDDSIARAKAARDQERAEITAKTGLRIADNGRIAPVVMACNVPGCYWSTRPALSDRRAVRALCTHLVKAHHWRRKES